MHAVLSVRAYYLHRTCFWSGMALLLLLNLALGGGWWTFWPMGIWSVLLLLHFCVFRSLHVDQGWARERARDLQARSYDLSHIKDIGQRIKDDHYSVRPSDDRD